ncbi:MAG: Sporulation initiation phosphotransferase F [Candidatus Scalindua arabica]|uniref:Sporulation initiation phosphotransferase F n=1 Tax=Candidatus Scalindua arabica TaxID=1127984 RepID=A0A941W1U1_9BACT|nr:Sporulation initiation phosphotransferase F [Candidatus Scalindua arabica]
MPKSKILVIDDEKDMCGLLDKLLSIEGYIVKIVANGAEALKLVKIEFFDLVLCDWVVLGVYGNDLIKALKKLKKRPKIGIITGWNGKLMSIENRNMNVDFIARKPFDLSWLSRQINDVISA